MPIEQGRPKRKWHFYLISSLSFLLTVLLSVAVVYFWEEIRRAQGYGYLGGFLVSILGGITIIPVPSLLLVFTLGGVLNPVYVGLVSGFGEAVGGVTVYLTGAGVGNMWSRVGSNEQTFEYRPGSGYGVVRPAQSKFWSKAGNLYKRLASSPGRRGSSWVVFVVSAFVWGLYYPTGVAAGTLRMGLRRFFLISWAGKTVRGLIVAYAGYWGLYFLLKWIGI